MNYYLSQVANEGWTFDELREKLGIESTLRYWMGNIRGDLTIIQEAVEREETMLTDLFDMECRDGKLVPLERKK